MHNVELIMFGSNVVRHFTFVGRHFMFVGRQMTIVGRHF